MNVFKGRREAVRTIRVFGYVVALALVVRIGFAVPAIAYAKELEESTEARRGFVVALALETYCFVNGIFNNTPNMCVEEPVGTAEDEPANKEENTETEDRDIRSRAEEIQEAPVPAAPPSPSTAQLQRILADIREIRSEMAMLRSISRTTAVVTEQTFSSNEPDLEAKLQALENELRDEMYRIYGNSSTPNNSSENTVNTIHRAIAFSNNIDSLSSVTLNDVTFTGSVSGLDLDYLPLTGGSLSGDLSIAGDLSVTASTTLAGVEYGWPSADGSDGQILTTNGAGVLSWETVASSPWTLSGSDIYYAAGNVGIGTTSPYAALSVVGEAVASHFTATSTTATSTFANHISIASEKEYRIGGVGILTRNNEGALVAGDLSGNARGDEALDIQSGRTANDQVAAGNESIAVGLQNKLQGPGGNGNMAFGRSNTITAIGFFPDDADGIAVGLNNSVSIRAGVAVGNGNTVNGVEAQAFGFSNTVGGVKSGGFGYGNTASANYAHAFGYGVTNNIANSTMIGSSNTAKITILSTGETQAPYFTATSTTATSTFANHISIASEKEYRIGGVGVLKSEAENSVNVGFLNTATAKGSAASGYNNTVGGQYSSGFGMSNTVNGGSALAFGNYNTSSGDYASTFGHYNTASANYTQIFGYSITNNIANSTMIGPSNTAKLTILSTGETQARYFTSDSTTATSTFANHISIASEKEYRIGGVGILTRKSNGAVIGGDLSGNARGTNAFDVQSYRSGGTYVASGNNSVASGISNTASGQESSAFGLYNTAGANSSSALGYSNIASGVRSTAVGYLNTVTSGVSGGYRGTAVGDNNTASANRTTALGYYNTASGHYSFAAGANNTAGGYSASAAGFQNTINGTRGSGFGYSNLVSGTRASAFGYDNTASGTYAVAGGYYSIASGDYSFAWGNGNNAIGLFSTSVGVYNTATADSSTVVGLSNSASGVYSQSVGYSNFTFGARASAFGYDNNASGARSSSFGYANYISAPSTNASAFGFNNTISALGASVFGSGITNDVASSTMIGPLDEAKVTILGGSGTEGYVGVATTSPEYPLHVELRTGGVGGTLAAGNVAGFTDSNGTCTIDPTNTALQCSSDERLKKNINNLVSSSVLEQVRQLQGVRYSWKKEEGSDPTRIGFIAQEVEEVFPEFVGEGPNGFKSVSYAAFTPVLVEAVKELDIRLMDLPEVLVTDESFIQRLTNVVVDRITGLGELVMGRIRTDELCIGDTCLSESQVQAILEHVGENSHSSTEEQPTANTEDTVQTPTITLRGNNPATIEKGTAFVDPGAYAEDPQDGQLMLDTTHNVDTTTPGEYTVTYTTIDSDTNTAEATRTVLVVDPNQPQDEMSGNEDTATTTTPTEETQPATDSTASSTPVVNEEMAGGEAGTTTPQSTE